MDHYRLTQSLRDLWTKAVEAYKSGNREAATYFNDEENSFLREIGHSAQEIYDFAEDYTSREEPDFETFLLIAFQRLYYFQHVMEGQLSDTVVDTGDLPPKDASVKGIEWLPRIIPKARAKLRGEMSDDLMFCCGGDRKFFKTHNIHPAEFLAFVARHFHNDEAIIDWVVSKSAAAKA